MKTLKIYFLASLVITIFSCIQNNDKLRCYSTTLKDIISTNEYKAVIESAKMHLANDEKSNVKKTAADSSFVISSRLDSAVFFNSKKDKCLLILLQKTAKDLKLDQARIMQGTLDNGTWYFSYDRLPQVPEVIYTLNKKLENGINLNNSFATLSSKSRMFVLMAGKVDVNHCFIDQEYWFGNSIN